MKRILLISALLLAVIFTVSADRRRLLGARNVAAGAATLLPLEELTTASYASWGVGRKLTNAYAGSLALVVRSSDKATNYLVSSGTGNNISDILTWAGSDNVYVTNLFDQTGNGRHLVQGDTNLCPLIVTNGVAITKNSKTVMRFRDDDYLITSALSPILPLTFVVPVYNDSRTAGDVIFSGNSSVRTAIKQGATAVYNIDSGGASFNTADALSLDVWDVVTAIFVTGTDSAQINAGTATTGAAGDNSATALLLGYPGVCPDMQICDLFVFNTSLSATDSGAVRTNVVNFYALP